MTESTPDEPPRPNGSTPRPRRPSGKPSRIIPALSEKIDYLLDHMGRNQTWLTQVLSDLSGKHPSTQSVANWRRDGTLPAEYLTDFCRQFSIQRSVLEEPDFTRFKAAVDNVTAPGSGAAWEKLLRQAKEPHDGLQLELDGVPPPRRLRNLYFPADGRPRIPDTPRLQHVHQDQQLRFVLPATDFVSSPGHAVRPDTIVLCCEDKHGWKTLCPHLRDPGFILEGKRRLMPGASRKALCFDYSLGEFRAVAVILQAPLPEPIAAELRADRTVVGTDMLALWLDRDNILAAVLQRSFLVVAPKSGLPGFRLG